MKLGLVMRTKLHVALASWLDPANLPAPSGRNGDQVFRREEKGQFMVSARGRGFRMNIHGRKLAAHVGAFRKLESPLRSFAFCRCCTFRPRASVSGPFLCLGRLGSISGEVSFDVGEGGLASEERLNSFAPVDLPSFLDSFRRTATGRGKTRRRPPSCSLTMG